MGETAKSAKGFASHIVLCLCVATASGQVIPLPPVGSEPPPQLSPWSADPVAYPRDLSESISEQLSPYTSDGEIKRISDIKSGMLQRLSFTGAWLPALDSDGLGMSDLEAYAVLGLPAPTTEWPLLVTPLFAVHYLDGPPTPDLPARLHDASVQFRWLPRLLEHSWGYSLRLDLAFEPGIHSDFESSDDDAWRYPGHALAIFELSPRHKLVAGLLYLDREDVNYLPAGGLIWSPNEDWQLDLIFPKPKIAQRLSADGCREWWHYLAAEFGGGPYSIRRTSGAQDVIILRDYRLYYGVEHKTLGGLSGKVEAGVVLGREVEFVSGEPTHEPGETLIVRAGVAY
jgi:hypothetical protein